MARRFLALVVISFAALATVHGQGRPAPAVDVTAGYAGFVDDATIDHGVIGGGARWHLTPRVSVGPELVYMIGPRGDRDVFLTGTVYFDVVRSRAVVPYLIGGAGLMLHRADFPTGAFWSKEAALTGGFGLRARVTDRLYIAPEIRLGWEPHWRAGVTLGWRPAM